jgi:hypothetical protein
MKLGRCDERDSKSCHGNSYIHNRKNVTNRNGIIVIEPRPLPWTAADTGKERDD